MSARLLFAIPLLLGSCVFSPAEDLASLALRPALPYSVLITGGGFVQPPNRDSGGDMPRTYELSEGRLEAFGLEELRQTLEEANVFVDTALDSGGVEPRRGIATLPVEGDGSPPQLQTLLERARRDGHDLLLVVESIRDGRVVSRGINDRWPFTLATWLFALGALVPDRSYESEAVLLVSMRDVHSGVRVIESIPFTPGEVTLSMLDRCGLWGFTQSALVPPFWTSTDPERIVQSVRAVSTRRLMVKLATRLKSTEVGEDLQQNGPAAITVENAGDAWRISVEAKEVLTTVDLFLDGVPLDDETMGPFQQALLESLEVNGGSQYRYSALVRLSRPGRLLRVLLQTKAARVSSVTQVVGGN